MDIYLPLWPSKLVVPMAFVVLVARLVLQAWGYGRAFVLGLSTPVAVPGDPVGRGCCARAEAAASVEDELGG